MGAAEPDNVVDAEIVEDAGSGGGEMVPQAQPGTLFRTDDPVQVLARATETANALRDVITRQNLYKRIGDKNHILVEGWQTLGAMLGVTAVCEWTRPLENGWEARVLAQTLDGRVIGAAEAQCLSTEGKPWNTAEGYAIRSMAQTRATSKALASVLRFVATLGGYDGTPAEEAEGTRQTQPEPEVETAPTGSLDPERVAQIVAGIKALGLNYKQIDLMLGSAGLDALRARSAKALSECVASFTAEQADAFEAELQREAEKDQ